MFKKLGLVVVGMAMLTGCGGSGPAGAEDKDKTPPAKIYSVKALKAALPTLDEVPNARELLEACPGSKDCVQVDGVTDNLSVGYELEPASPVDPERQEQFIGSDKAYVSVQRYGDESNAAASMASARKRHEERDGVIDIKPLVKADGATVPGERGEGTLTDIDRGEWSGYQLDTHLTLTYPGGEESEPRQDANAAVALGRYRLQVLVTLGGSFERGAASELATQLLDDYLERLG